MCGGNNLYIKQVASVSVCLSVYDGHISLTVSQTDLRFRMWLAHGTKLCILDFEDFCLRFSKDDYLRRPSNRGSVLFPRGPLLGGLHPISLCDMAYTHIRKIHTGIHTCYGHCTS